MNKREGGGMGGGESGNNTMKPLLWNTSVQETRAFKGHQIGPENVYIILPLKVRKNWQEKTCNLFCNIAAKRVE